MVEKIKRTVIDIVLLFLLIIALVGYDQAVRPYMPAHESRQTVETEYWLDNLAHVAVLNLEKKGRVK